MHDKHHLRSLAQLLGACLGSVPSAWNPVFHLEIGSSVTSLLLLPSPKLPQSTSFPLSPHILSIFICDVFTIVVKNT